MENAGNSKILICFVTNKQKNKYIQHIWFNHNTMNKVNKTKINK